MRRTGLPKKAGITPVHPSPKGRVRHGWTIEFRLPGVIDRLLRPLRWVLKTRLLWMIALFLLVFALTEVIPIWQPRLAARTYALDSHAKSLLFPTNAQMAAQVHFTSDDDSYHFNASYNPTADTGGVNAGGSHISATLPSHASKGITVTDPVSSVNFTMTPRFDTRPAAQQDNRIVYPLADNSGWLVYTLGAQAVKEDLILRSASGNTASYSFHLALGDTLAARMMSDGGVGIYGSSLFSATNISTGSSKDAALLQKARQHATKDTLMFVIPAPVVNQLDAKKHSVKAHYSVSGETLTVQADNLKAGTYPLSIDPSVYVTSAQQFMQGNNESNIDYDTSNDLIQKGKLTGARLSTAVSSGGWTSTTALNAARWNAGYATGGGYQYVVGGSNGSTNQSSVYWAQYSTSNSTINTPANPGTGVNGCNSAAWCTNATYNLPNPRVGLGSVVYNGFLYAIGGYDASCTGSTFTVCSTVYVSKLGANGEPNTWSTSTSLNTPRAFAGIAAYNNHIYVVGGQTGASQAGDNGVEVGNISPNGMISSWTTSGTTIPTAGRWGATALQYNGYLYLIGGASTTTTTNSVQYIKINADGSLSSSWVTTSSFTNARATFGGTFATVYGGYVYVTSGCATLTATACSTLTPTTFNSQTATINGTSHTFNTQTDFQYASINADGSLATFTVSAQNPFSTPVVNGTPLTSAAATPMTGYGLTAWRGNLYAIGGCTAVSATTTCSGTTQTQATYATVNSDGDVSPTFGSASSNFYNGTAYMSDLPPAGTAAGQGGRLAAGVVINNGIIYSIGGCANVGCSTMSRNIASATVSSTGSVGTWTVDSTHLLAVGVGAFGVTVHNNVIWVVGGATGSGDSQAVQYTVLTAAGALGNWTNTGNNAASASGYIYTFARAIPNNGTQSYLYMIGGCTNTSGIGCSGYSAIVTRCAIANGGGTPTCTGTVGGVTMGVTGMLQLQTGTGIFGGAVYGNYVYLAGGANGLVVGSASVSPTGNTCAADEALSPAVYSCGGQLSLVQYAYINTAGAITRTDGSTVTGGWHIATSKLTQQRRRTVAFAINGYFYVVAGHDGTAGGSGVTLNDIIRGKINVNTGDITGFTTLTTTISSRWDLRAVQGSGYIYMLGGCTTGFPPANCTAFNGVGEYVQVYNNWNASPASYTSSANLPTTDRYGGAATILNGYIYLAGGCTSTAADCSSTTTGTTTNDVSFAPLNADGSIGTWSSGAGYTLPASLAFGRMETVGKTLYYMGGQTAAGVAQSTIYYTTPSIINGIPPAWSTATNGLPAARSQFSTAVYNDKIYAVGGFSGTNATPTTTVYYSPSLATGGDIASTWTTNGTSYQLARSGAMTIAYGNNLYVLGGFDGTNYLLDVQYAPINANGSLGSWKFGPSLPQTIRQGDAYGTNGFLYVFGGRSAAAVCTANTYDIAVNADGSLASWSQTSVAYSGTRYGLSAAYNAGRTYILGGVCGATLTGANRAAYGTLQIQPQVANYSLLIDTSSDVFPSKYLINGLDNGIGAAWYLNYISSTDAANSWGQNTSVGKLTLGTPGTYTPVDGSNANTSFARYYMFFLQIDDQQAFGYPEDITRGPNIYDLTLQFTSDPSKRLRNGKTFVNGQQQPLDTPF